MRDFKLYFVADIKPSLVHSPTYLITQAVAGGVDIVQLRYKNASTRQLLDLGQQIKPILQAHNVPFIINDRVDVALALGADGVHLGQEDDMPLGIARCILGPDKIIGLSTHNLEQALSAQDAGADYLAIGAIFITNTKKMPALPLGTEILKKFAQCIHIPWLTIGGINLSNLQEVLQAGAKRVAVVSAIADAGDITKASQTLKTCLINNT